MCSIVAIMALAITIIIVVQVVDCPAGAEEGRTRPAPAPAKAVELDPWSDESMESRAAVIRQEEAAKLQERVKAVRRAREEGPQVEPTGDPVLDSMTAAVIKLQPYIYGGAEEEARSLASVIHDAAMDNGVDPWVALAVARRESSLHPRVGLGQVTGSLGELGYFQVFPGGAAERMCGQGCDQADPGCNARTATCWMAHVREQCGDDPWSYVGAYGRRRCPRNTAEARRWPEVRRAREFLCEAMGASCDTTWPE